MGVTCPFGFECAINEASSIMECMHNCNPQFLDCQDELGNSECHITVQGEAECK